ncbi:hypothetical protein BX600DRAFT_404258 [Xylariales sp. PMI_506]|nr:hypothetical protein BX600DRAFT_404258 [Xylariales sp. PMI_506]
MAAAGVDVGYLATHLGMPEENLVTLTSDPTTELVNAVLAAIAAKAHEFDALFSQKVQLEVELETAVHSAEARRDASNETAKKAMKDVEEIRQKLHQEETARQALENELQSIKSSNSTSVSEIESLRSRIKTLEANNRESLAIIDKKNSANDTLSQELQTQHQKNLKLNQELTNLQQTVQNANNSVNTAKFKEQSLRQELEMAQRSAEFFENEYKNKSAEVLKVRKEKSAQISQLQRENEDLRADRDSKDRLNQQLRKQLDDSQEKLERALSEKQQAIESAARKEEGLHQDLDATKRLVTLKDEQYNSQKGRLKEMELRLDQVKRDGEDAVRRISEDLEQTNQAREQATAEAEGLRADVGRLEAMLAGTGVQASQPGSAPQTPRPLNGSVLGGRPGSPFATPGSVRKSISATQALEEVYRLKGLLAVEKQRNQALAKEFDDMVDQLEAKGPEIDELQSENERLQREIQNMSHLSDESFKERDLAKKAARKAEANFNTAQAEANILRSQIRDLSAQMQMMIFSQEHQGQELTSEELLQLQRIERGNGFTTDDMSDVDTLITERLVVFKNIKDLQEKNQELLKVIHQLSEDMKNAEDAEAKQRALEDHNERIRLEEKVKNWEDRFRAFKVQTESIMKERDMFRNLVQSRASAAQGSAIDGASGVLASIEENENSIMGNDASDLAAVLRELQQSYDTYRTEQAVSRETMKNQVESLSSEKNSLQAEKSKLSSQLSLQEQRYEMLQSNFTGLQGENKELQKRLEKQYESTSLLDIRVQQAAEELVGARSEVESLRNENANLKAEKNLWHGIRERLSQDNDNLVQEKSRLNGLLATQQSLQNERDLTEAETKRRLQGQIDELQNELSTTKRKLSDEVEESKKLQLRKEFDAQQSQKRIDELTSNLSQIREELVAAKTSKDHLQARVGELEIQLRSAAERAERLQPRPTPRPGSMVAAGESAAAPDAEERIEELNHEVSDLKRDLELTVTHLENAKAQVEQYKELSQSNEEELQRLSSAQDEYVQEVESSLAAKDATIKELEQRVEDLSAELGRSNNELSSLRDSQAEIAHRFEDEKAILEEEVKRLKDQEDNYTASSQFHQQDLRVQAEIATNAQQAYENEVAKHGETAKNLQSIRTEYNELRTAAATLRAEAESAKATLLQNESSWEDRRKRLEQELSELRVRRDDADKQNKLLHQQLESISSQVVALQQNRASADESTEALTAQPTSTSEEGLREISNYLRREKDILEVQYDLKVRETKRLQETLEHTQSQLDDARLKLEQERQSQSNSDRATLSHKDLMAKLEELNLYRESTVALRTEARQAQAQLAEKIAKVEELEARVQPLEAQIEELTSQIGYKEAEIKQVHEDRDRWQKRTEDILSKHGRVDQQELNELKETIAALEAERDALREAEQPLKDRIQELEKTIEEKESGWQASREKLVAQFKERSRNLTAANKEVAAERDRLQAELGENHNQLASTQQDLDAEKQKYAAAEEQIKAFQAHVQSLQVELEQAKSSIAPSTPPAPPAAVPADISAAPATADNSDSQQVADLERQLAEAKTELESISAQKSSVEQDLEGLRQQLNAVTAERDQALANAGAGVRGGDVAMENGATEPTTSALTPAAASSLTDEERQALEHKIAEAEAKAAEFEAKAAELETNQTAIVAARSEKMKTMLNDKLREKNAQMEKERAELKQTLERQQADFNLRIEQEKKIWEVERMTSAPELKPPATPAQQPPSTPGGATPSASTAGLENISDADARRFVATNDTIKGIITANVKNKVAEATKKLREECEQNHVPKSELDQKIAQAKESASKMAASKASVQVNMAENRARTAQAKLVVVESAAKETPEKPVGEVWEIAKVARPPPAQPKQPPPSPAPNNTATASTPATPTSNGAHSQVPKLATGIPKPQLAPATTPAAAAAVPANPFATAQAAQQGQPAAPNPFAPTNAGQTASQAPQPQAGQPAPAAAAGQAAPQVKSGIPAPSGLPKSNLRQPSGTYQAPRGGARGGRGGGRGGNRASLNPGADNFQPGTGNKRPRGDSEVGTGAGAKRIRGGGPAAQ